MDRDQLLPSSCLSLVRLDHKIFISRTLKPLWELGRDQSLHGSSRIGSEICNEGNSR